MFSIFGIWWLISDLIRETFLRWCGSFVDRRHKAWRVALSCIFWTIWKERNRRCFECEELLNQRLKDIFLNNFLVWVRDEGESIFLCTLFPVFCLVLFVYNTCTLVHFLRLLI